MKTALKIGTLFRIRLRIHYTWLFGLILISLAVSTQFSTELSLAYRMSYGIAAAVLYMVAILFRELLLILMAVYKGLEVKVLTVFVFGGLMEIDDPHATPSHELLLGITGMLCNLLITGIFYFTYVFLGRDDGIAINVILRWLAFLFFTLSLYHIIPAYPLEGGRVLNALLWKTLGDVRKAMRISGWTGWVLGFLTMAGGIMLAVFTVELFTGIFFMLLGLIIQNAATHARRQKFEHLSHPPAAGEDLSGAAPEMLIGD